MVNIKVFYQDEEADPEVGQEDDGNDEDAGDAEAKVPPELEPDDLVRLPGCVDLQGESVIVRAPIYPLLVFILLNFCCK